MARVATAYVEIKPDLTGFAKELKAKLTALKFPVQKIKVDVDIRNVTESIKKATPDIAEGAGEAGKKAGSSMSEAMAEAVKKEFVKDFSVDREGMTDKSKRIGDLMAKALASQAHKGAEEFVDQFAIDMERRFIESVRKPLDAFNRETKLNMKFAADDAAKAFAAEWKAKFGDVALDEATIRRITREFSVKFGNVGEAAALAMATSLRRDQDRMLTQAFKENDVRIRHQAEDAAEAFRTRFRGEFGKLVLPERSVFRQFEVEMFQAFGAIGGATARGMIQSMTTETSKAISESAKTLGASVLSEFGAAMSAVSNGWSKLLTNPLGIALVAGVVVFAGTFVAAWIGALTAALAGVGVLGLGAFLIANDKEVAEAGSHLGKTMSTAFTDSARGLVDPLLRGLGRLENMIPAIAKQAQGIFSGLGPQMTTLITSAGRFVSEFLSGIQRGLPGIKGVLDGLADGLPRIGKAIGSIFEKMSDDPKAARKVMEGLITAIENVINVLGSLLGTTVKWAAFFQTWTRNIGDLVRMFSLFSTTPWGDGFRQLIADWGGGTDRANEYADAVAEAARQSRDFLSAAVKFDLPDISTAEIEAAIDRVAKATGKPIKDSQEMRDAVEADLKAIKRAAAETTFDKFAKDAKTNFKAIDKATTDARKAVDALIDSIDVLNGRFVNLQEAEDDFARTTNQLTEDLKEREHVIDGNSDAALDNRAALREMAKGIEDTFRAALKQGETVEQATERYNTQRQTLIDMLGQFGVTGAAAEAYANKLLATPAELKTQLVALGFTPENAQAIIDQATGMGQTAGAGAAAGFVAGATVPGIEDVGKQWKDQLNRHKDDHRETARQYGMDVGKSFSVTAAENGPGKFDVGKQYMDQLKNQAAANQFKAEVAGIGAGTSYNTGLSSQTPTVASTAAGMANSVAGAVNISLYTQGANMATTLGRGLADYAGLPVQEAHDLAQRIRNFYPASPAKEGPLSGAGDPYRSGKAIASRLSDGMRQGESKVEDSAMALANASRIVPAYAGMSMVSDSLAAQGGLPKLTVYIGNDQIKGYIHAEIDDDNEDLARSLMFGRSGN